ncbi:ethanolaminephosphotransferase 1 isoform X2 [Anopheles bellator]|uniref:ethanolaminephosphotransferase 1 isoform X2 n=1 Tax=Anopheles bellator TaxID=139047 RepID=UPI00264945F9|nr:ethanolaminephosphotransferase 1 isoform X2 [Anopheles bellator]
MIGIKYLNEAHLKGFEKYKYNCVDTSILSVYVMHPFWNKVVLLCPRWVAPNLLTFTGFMLTVVNFFLIGYYDRDFKAATETSHTVPNWVWLLAAINLFVAYTLDGIDGKQARRTGTSGPLGELFDHGLDSYSAVLIPIYVFSIFGSHDLPPVRMFFITLNVFLNFYLPHVEKYITGIMFLPWGYDFVMWGVSITLAITGIFGAEFWQIPVFGMKPCHIFELTLYVSAIITSHPIIITNIYKSYRDKTGKMRSFKEAIRPLVPLASLFVLCTLWVLLSRNGIIDMEPRLYFVMCGTLFSNICCRLIVSQMSDTRADLWNALLNLLCVTVAFGILPYTSLGLPELDIDFERYLLYALTFFVTIAHLHYGAGVVQEMCHHFRIRCFKITPAPLSESATPVDGMEDIAL